MKDKRLVIIKWVDSGRGTEWEAAETIPLVLHPCFSVGWMFKETNDVYVVAPHYSVREDDVVDQLVGYITIPKVAVVSVADVQMPTSRKKK